MNKISVIVPIYNTEKYVKQSLESICNQTLKDIEIICVNDGTPDNSMDIVKKIEKKDKRIKIINKKNGGLSSARNAGIKVADGKYIYFFDSDDMLKENALEILYKKMEKDNLDTLFFDAEVKYESEEIKKLSVIGDKFYQRKNKYKDSYTGQELFKIMNKNDEYRCNACIQINKTSLLKNNDIRFYEGIIHEDELFTLNICLVSKIAGHINENLFIRYIRKDSIMTSSNPSKRTIGYFISLLESMKLILKLSKKENYQAFKDGLSKLQDMTINQYLMINNISDLDEQKKQLEYLNEKLTPENKILFELLIEKNIKYQLNDKSEKKENKIINFIKEKFKKYN